MTLENKRSQHTKSLIKNALIDLLLKESFNSITVKKICEKAEVNRSTFYVYYKDPVELLSVIEEETIDLIINSFSLDIPSDNIIDYIDHFLIEVKDNHERFKVLLGLQADPSFSEKLISKVGQATLIKTILSEKVSIPTSNITQLIYCGTFYMSGAYSIIVKWINANYDLSTRELAFVLRDMLKKCFDI
jgi:AcrR family transcriptional regulator